MKLRSYRADGAESFGVLTPDEIVEAPPLVRVPPVFLQPGDEVEFTGLRALRNRVVGAAS